ncbi:MAG: hypothetical protein FJ358_06215 [Thaumarchaeota archaeon]|nr:hypothetical protein [Nitrososphaerota archaeon]
MGIKIAKITTVFLILLLLAQVSQYAPLSEAVAPGNSITNALSISSGRANATFADAPQYFKLNVQTGSILSIQMDVPPGSDLDLTLYDPDSTNDDPKQIAESKNLGDGNRELIEFQATKTGFHYVKVSGVRHFGTSTYTISFFITNFRVLFAGFGTQDSQAEVAPGDLGTTLSLVVRNGADFAITDLIASIDLPRQFTNSTSGNMLRQALTSTIAVGQSATFSFLLNIAPSASIGTYTVTLRLDYLMSSGLVKGITVKVPVQISITGRSLIRLVTDNQFLFPETTNDVTLKLKNEGTAPTGIIDFSLSVPSPLTLVGSDNKWTLPSLQAGQEFAISSKIFAPSASKGQVYQITCTATFKTAVGSSRTETRVVSLVVQAVGRGVISVASSYWGSNNAEILVAPGDRRATLTVTIQNLDNGQITGMSQILRLLPPFTNSTGGNTIRAFYPNAIPSGGSASTSFLLNVANDAQVRRYSLDMVVSYLDQRSLLQTVEVSVPVTIVGRSNIRVNVPANVLLSGTANDVSVEIVNSGTAPVYLVNVALTFVASSPLSVVGGDAQRLVDVIEAGGLVRVPYRVYTSPSTSEGLYTASFSITYRDTNGQSASETKSLGFVIKSWTSQIMAESANMILAAGSVNKVSIKVRNTGNQAISSVTATLSVSSGAAPLSLAAGNNQWNFDQIAAKGEVTIDTQLFATVASADSSYPVQVQVSYLDSSGYPHSETKTVSFIVKGWVSPIAIETQQLILLAGSVNPMSIKIKNTGNQQLSAVQATLSFAASSGSSPLILASGSPTYSFNQIAAGGEAEIKPTIFATLAAADASYQLQIQVIYTDAGGYQHTDTKSFGLSVRGKIVLETQSLSVVPVSPTPGGNVTVVGNLLNKGTVVARYTEAKVLTSGPIRPNQGSNQYLGDVDPNTPVPFSVTFQLNRTAQQGRYPVTVQFVYEDEYGTKFTSESRLQITIGQQRQQAQQVRQVQQGFSAEDVRLIFIAGFALIILLGLAVIFRSRRKARREVL